MTMANSTMTSHTPRTAASLRKTNKPLMEKRRRARINDSLSQLKSLVIQGSKKDSSQFNKLEKADILELTVKHLRTLQSQEQMAQASNSDPSLAGKYQAGFMECANEVIRFLGQSHGFSDDTKARVISHLASCIQLASKAPVNRLLPSGIIVPSTPAVSSSGQSVDGSRVVNAPIIHIVNGPLQNTKPSPVSHYPAASTVQILPTAAPAVQKSPVTFPVPDSTSSVVAATSSSAASEPTHYIRYTQPLHIQIPPVISPVIVQPQPAQPPQVQLQQQQQPQQPARPLDLSPQVHSYVSVQSPETFISSASPSPHKSDRCMSPPTIRPSHKYRYQSPYSHDELNHDFSARSRTYSTTSNSSSESEMSPLNLSQSPGHYELQKENSYALEGRRAYHNSHHYEPVSPDLSLYKSNFSSLPVSHFASVIVNGRKSLDHHDHQCMTMMMETDRSCIRHADSTSPASSVGEERLWRPWSSRN